MRKELHRMEVSYIRGRTRDPRADSEGNIAFRKSYLQKNVSNLNARKYPKIPEIFLDESFCNVNHFAGSTWLLKNSALYSSSGRGQRYCIVRAGPVLVKNGKLHAEWVPDSVEFWPSHYKSTDTDYHGNFNGTLFLKWFEGLCAVLELVYGPCRIRGCLPQSPNQRTTIKHGLKSRTEELASCDLLQSTSLLLWPVAIITKCYTLPLSSKTSAH
ncbi:hypothetical protein PHMEG_00016958 [Phytophthora megakarya]|uniref:Uncharacterized protein n=1 Tax=Phytophthora megakarya TaxID=4795 RepID=A0A225VXS2_9STRA|nr:hypothetical protein PHMEG_00016958 [Phytophthora megakarya]